MLPRVSECVDRTIIDEAGMIPLHQSFPLLIRSRKAIIVGDPLQIEPVITLSDQRRDNYRQTAFIDKGLTEIDYIVTVRKKNIALLPIIAPPEQLEKMAIQVMGFV
jgi:hypothetical protein